MNYGTDHGYSVHKFDNDNTLAACNSIHMHLAQPSVVPHVQYGHKELVCTGTAEAACIGI